MVQFTVSNVGFFKAGKVVPRTSPLQTLLSCNAATLKISNQKNGKMGNTIHHKAIVLDTNTCPIKALAYRVHHILSNNGHDDTLLCAYSNKNAKWHTIQSGDIVTAVCSATKILKLEQQAIEPDLVGAHSLQAGGRGGTALKLTGATNINIKKYGQWSSLTFTQYIHIEIAHLSNLSTNAT